MPSPRPEIGAGEVEKFESEGVAAIVGAYSSGISLATTQAAANTASRISSMSA